MRSIRWTCTTAAAFAVAAGAAAAPAPAACGARSGPLAASVVELYTSEGCDSCPPADRWLAGAGARPGVVALAFHVDYWDRLGWIDRYASPAWTRRQAEQHAVNGARFSYTPQVVVDGRDRTDWPGLAPAAAQPSQVDVVLVRDGTRVRATVTPSAAAPRRLAAAWAVTESGHRSVVQAGENRGRTLDHDFVVRALQPVPAWAAAPGAAQALVFDVPPGDTTKARQVDLVVLDAATGRPVQAVALGC
jgi:hypothetical protein